MTETPGPSGGWRLLALTAAVAAACLSGMLRDLPAEERRSAFALEQIVKQLEPLHEKMPSPKPGDWLAKHRESGQTFREYQYADPNRPGKTRKVIYIQPLGDFTAKQREIVTASAEFMSLYFGLKVKVEKDLPLSEVPDSARRINDYTKEEQLLSTYILDKLLFPRVPEDAIAYLAFTASDLWPGEGWNFVYGQADLYRRVGVWSIHRNGDPNNPDEYKLCLLRTLKTGTHETGHMFTLEHCTKWQCNMNGSNHRDEADSKPLWLCPECAAKICWACGLDPAQRFWRLSRFCASHELEREEKFYLRSLAAIGGADKPAGSFALDSDAPPPVHLTEKLSLSIKGDKTKGWILEAAADGETVTAAKPLIVIKPGDLGGGETACYGAETAGGGGIFVTLDSARLSENGQAFAAGKAAVSYLAPEMEGR